MGVAVGRLYGIGLGPGDPELLTVKAVGLLRSIPIVAYFAKAGRRGHARTIADRWMRASCKEMPLFYPITTEIPFNDPAYVTEIGAFYREAAKTIATCLTEGNDVALLCEGDPLFYGSFIHIFVRLKEQFSVIIVPGVTGMSGCWTAARAAMTWGDDILTILPGTLGEKALVERLAASDAAVVMKLGRNFAKVRAAIATAGLMDRAIYVERGTMTDQVVVPLKDKTDETSSYFAVVLVPGRGRRQ